MHETNPNSGQTKFLFFDTETTGLPKNYNASAEDVDNWPRIIQLAYMTFNANGEVLKSYCRLIKPDGWEIPKEEFWINNGYSTEKSIELGVPIRQALEELISERRDATHTIAHNISFDSKIVRAEMFRLNDRTEFTGHKICTMHSSTAYCKIPYRNGRKGNKWPTLTELYESLFNKQFENAHDALADVRACAESFFELTKRKVIDLDKLVLPKPYVKQ